MKRKIKILVSFFVNLWVGCITYLPGDIGFILRYRFWKKKLKHLGKDVKIDIGVCFQNPDFISIDDNCWIDKNVTILAGMDKSKREKVYIDNKEFLGEPGVVFIGKNIHVGVGCIISGISAGVYISDDCGFSAGCKIYAFSHHYKSKMDPTNTNINFGTMVPHNRQCLIEGPVFIGCNTGFALNSIILPGVSISSNSFIAINSVVSKGGRQYEENSLIAGNPAKIVGRRFLLKT